MGCLGPYYGEREEYTPPKNEPAVVIYDYQIARVDNGELLGKGCAALPSLRDEMGAWIQARIPLGVEYDTVFHATRAPGTIESEADRAWFCGSLVSKTTPHARISPRCYASHEANTHQLIDAFVVDAQGSRYSIPSDVDTMNAGPNDIETFRLVSHATGSVILDYYGQPCPPATDGTKKPYGTRWLLTVLP